MSSNGQNLAVGATGDDGNSNSVSNSGAVHLFTFTDSSFSGGAHSGTIGQGYSTLDIFLGEANDAIGSSVAFNSSATMLAIGVDNDDGDTNVSTSSGAVYLISFSNSAYSSPTIRGVLGRGYKTGNSIDLSGTLNDGDAFGSSVSFSDDGTRLAVGAINDDGSGNTNTDTGAVYVFGFENENYKTPTLLTTIGDGYTGTYEHDVSLDDNDEFGASVAFNDDGTRLAVGAPLDDGDSNAGDGTGAVYLLSFGNANYTSMTHTGTVGYGYNKNGDFEITDLDNNDRFGAAVAFDDGDRLVIGAPDADGQNDDLSGSGMVKLVKFANSNFGTAELISTIIDSPFVNDLPNNNLATNNELLGTAVALNGSGNRLAVGGIYDTGSPQSGSKYGAVHLYSFTDTNFSGAVLEGTIGKGYTGGKNVNFDATAGDFFGHGISLNSAGDRLAIGETGYNSNRGAAHLFTFTDTSFTGGTLAATVAQGVSGTNDVPITLGVGDYFGSSVALSGDGEKLAVGAIYGDGDSNNHSATGEVYLFTFNDTDFTGGQLIATIGDSYTSGQDINIDLASYDKFGRSVSLDYDGNRLAVGASEDVGPDGKSDAGAVYLFSFDDLAFTDGALTATIGDGYTGSKNVNIANLAGDDQFGIGVSLNAIGDRLAVGAFNDDGNGNSATNSGAAYLISFSDDEFSSGTLRHIIGSGYNTGNNVNLTTLEAGDRFGMSVALNDAGDRLAVGAHQDDGRYNMTNDSGGVYLFSATRASGGYPSDGQTFANLESSDVTVNAYEVADLLNRGNNVTLQASNDITISNAVQVGGYVQNAGNITLRAGRSIAINESLITNGGDISLYANDTAGNGVVAAQRDAGAATISLAANKSLNASGGDVSVILANASDRTNNTSGDISLAASAMISGNTVMVRNEGPTSGSDVNVASGGQISASASGNAIIVVGDNFNNSAGANVLNPLAGRYQLWTNDDTGYDISVLAPDFIQYGATYGTSTIAGGASEDGVFYTDTATVTPDFRSATVKTYDGTTTATVADSDIGVAGANTGETVVLTAGSAAFDNKNAGSSKTVTLTGLSVASASRGSIDNLWLWCLNHDSKQYEWHSQSKGP